MVAPIEASSARADDRRLYAFQRNVFVAASAGTGKTYRLTALYVLLALGLTSMGEADEATPAPALLPENIVATTFSRAAAREIAERVERALRAVAAWRGHGPLPFDAIVRERLRALGAPVDAQTLRERAQAALDRFPAARIDTLHGVARRIVQSSALSLAMSPDVRVLDEEEAHALADLVTDEALSAALAAGGESQEVARSLIQACGGVDRARAEVQVLLDRLDEEGLGPEELVVADHAAEARALWLRVVEVARAVAEGGAARSHAAAFLALVEQDPAAILPDGSTPHLVELLTKRLPSRGKRTAGDDQLEALVDGLLGRNKLERAEGLIASLWSAPELSQIEHGVVRLLVDCRRRFLVAKRRAGGLGFGDLLRVARDALRDVPAIAADARAGIGALLVDEFQDTSRVQRDLVYLLRELPASAAVRGPSAPSSAGLCPHGLFLVGDRKQSIYGFRGADVGVFAEVAVELAGARAVEALALGRAAPASPPIAEFVALTESHRSRPEVLAYVNEFAARDFVSSDPSRAQRGFEVSYGPGDHLVPAPAFAPATEAPGRVLFVDDDGSSPVNAPPIVTEASGSAREAHVAAALVARLAREGFAFRDVAVLARRRSTIPLVETALARLSIPYVVAGRALYDAPEVRDLAALLRVLVDPHDRLALAVVLRGPLVALSEASLVLLSRRGWGALPVEHLEDGSPSSAPSAPERRRLAWFDARVAELRAPVLRLAPADAIRRVLSGFEIDQVSAALPRGDTRLGNLDRLIAIARRRGGTVASFVHWLERRIRDQSDEAEAAMSSDEDDAVRITTIHASKGLDFRAVVVVDLNAAPRGVPSALAALFDQGGARLAMKHFVPRPPLDPQVVDGSRIAVATATQRAYAAEAQARELAERRRLSYVAFTRAKEVLALVGSCDKPRAGAALQTVRDLAESSTLVQVERAAEVLSSAVPVEMGPPAVAHAPPPRALTPMPPARVRVAVGELGVFCTCPRRAWLRVRCGLGEDRALRGRSDGPLPRREEWRRAPSLDGAKGDFESPADEGYLLSVKSSCRLSWSEPFVVRRRLRDGLEVTVHGELGLAVFHGDGAVDLLALVTEPERSIAQVEVELAFAALSAIGEGQILRCGVLDPAGPGEPTWLPVPPLPEEAIDRLLQEWVAAAQRDHFDGRSKPTCLELRCGYLDVCHPA